MYTLYFSPGTCALATHAILNELGQTVKIVDRANAENFEKLNPVGAVPVLKDGDLVLTEGAAILLHLLDKHPNPLLPKEGIDRSTALSDMLFANATMHPAYGRLFFVSQLNIDSKTKQTVLEAAAGAINALWQVVEARLQTQSFLGGETPSPADFLLAVYSSWGGAFPVDIKIGPQGRQMIEAIQSRPGYQLALNEQQSKAAA
ncbi:glutathione S-transferase family protein [Aliikangiella coralliicola]|uniref:Glutathione S-transferase family protein n=1 Tax=Aliikangiella coralliicola TaxID=2592383 RepID=A0A545UH99_9GAMM|nr:glutathione S-transferase family protein [Aliikangiella coralliicola]TQV88840.1 glutathione S-transferase family protein [Aliikangiella coralliicola]